MECLASEYSIVDNAFQEFTSMLNNVDVMIAEKWKEFKQHRAELEAKIDHCNQIAHSSDHRMISLNIGGSVFTTTEATLLQEKESFFWAMLHSGKWQPDLHTGQYFIDRSPQMFGVILDYLRYGKVGKMHDLTQSDKNMLRDELDFYGITSFPHFETNGNTCSTGSVSWDPDFVTGDRSTFTFKDNNHVLFVSGLSQTKRVWRTQLFPNSNVVKFTLTITATFETVSPQFFLGHFGIGLLSGRVTFDSSTWKDLLPLVADLVREYAFEIDRSSQELTIKWPTGVSKTVQLPSRVEFGELSCAAASNTTFHLT
eukprot:TRINITY_DN66157_c4_g1_i1.p1 TRINITY_DN66157_c4_g1~~TRINITY_DN66157_c4_g1_i1.p1  ORF type:complete len:312 (+),score=33.75 TRINITY_DN66157_c4_g1_i1:25-960(+)